VTNARLQLFGGNATGSYTAIRFSQTGSFEALFGAVQTAAGTADFIWQGYNGSAYAERMRLDASGNLGIGTSSPGAKLGVQGLSRFDVQTYATGYALSLEASSETSRKYQLGMATGGVFALYDTAAAAQRLVVDSSGNLGIGTSSPAYKLDVAGAARVNSGSAGGLLQFGNGVSAASRSWRIWNDVSANGDFVIGQSTTQTGSTYTDRLYISAAGNLGLGVTPSAWSGYGAPIIQLPNTGTIVSNDQFAYLGANWYYGTSAIRYITSSQAASYYGQAGGVHSWYTAPSGTAGNAISFTQAMTLDASGNLLVGTTSTSNSSKQTLAFDGIANNGFALNDTNASSISVGYVNFSRSGTSKGGISYSNTSGLVSYNTTSDYRAKDIIGPVTGSGALIDSVPVYMGKMHGATQERPMFIAHETPEYAHTGEKDAVDADGNPVYQQMDASALIPVMWAEIQSLRARLAAANI
jgi:hypothetical protein